MIIEILSGIGAGITYGLSAFGKKEGQQWDWTKFVTTIIIGAGVGLGNWALKIDMSVINTWLINAGAVVLIENVLKIIWRKLKAIFTKKTPVTGVKRKK